MPGYVSQEQIAQARQIDLLTYLQTYEPDSIRESGANEYCLKEHDSLKISNGKWNWFSRGFGGKDALTFLVKVRGVGFVDAVNTLNNGFAAPASSFQPISPPAAAKKKQKRKFALPAPYKNNARVTAYLQKRGIDRAVIDDCIAAGTLYEAKKYHNAVFVGRDTENTPRFACVRSTASNYRQDIEGSDKRYSFSIPSSDPDSRCIMIAEAPIDALSLATMCKMNTGEADKYHYLSLCGTSPLALAQYLGDNPKIDYVIVCLDNDAAGRKCMNRIKDMLATNEKLKNRRISLIAEPPPEGVDFNDTLMAVLRKDKSSIIGTISENKKKIAPKHTENSSRRSKQKQTEI